MNKKTAPLTKQCPEDEGEKMKVTDEQKIRFEKNIRAIYGVDNTLTSAVLFTLSRLSGLFAIVAIFVYFLATVQYTLTDTVLVFCTAIALEIAGHWHKYRYGKTRSPKYNNKIL